MILCLFKGSMTGTQNSPQPAPAQATTFDERLGDDDGAALAMLISANERGNLDVCD
jgi:hypothetical protein